MPRSELTNARFVCADGHGVAQATKNQVPASTRVASAPEARPNRTNGGTRAGARDEYADRWCSGYPRRRGRRVHRRHACRAQDRTRAGAGDSCAEPHMSAPLVSPERDDTNVRFSVFGGLHAASAVVPTPNAARAGGGSRKFQSDAACSARQTPTQSDGDYVVRSYTKFIKRSDRP